MKTTELVFDLFSTESVRATRKILRVEKPIMINVKNLSSESQTIIEKDVIFEKTICISKRV